MDREQAAAFQGATEAMIRMRDPDKAIRRREIQMVRREIRNLKALSDKAAQGLWRLTPATPWIIETVSPSFDPVASVQVSNCPNWQESAEFIVALVNAYRAGALVERDDR